MDYQLMFSAVGIAAMLGWLTLVISPLMPVWSDRIAGMIVPFGLSVSYLVLMVLFPADKGGFGTFAEVVELFTHPTSVMMGWVHFLAFDLLVGAWICRIARREHIKFWFVLPCLPVTFMFGPLGFLLFSAVRGVQAVAKKS